ncbi:protocadherin gamma-B7 [Octopus bimaculoides]|uniref:Cadherin domain-containing protein n=1 Tax=Octopus bimaculoides TaxID=37653 RepID=A0A0L8HFE1_OCTBM|nr:protocadherin gamma-B7 [Octopus bimaculoides]|eukprot:XP_014772752.1 PREDICTED: protocadherin gamma-B7-like [Octopus bimaculoides]
MRCGTVVQHVNSMMKPNVCRTFLRHVVAMMRPDKCETIALSAFVMICPDVCRIIVSRSIFMTWIDAWRTLARHIIAGMQTNRMLFKISLMLYVIQSCACVDLVYVVEENQIPGTYLGNIAEDSHILKKLSVKDRSQVRFSLLQEANENSSLFNVTEFTGKLYTTRILDAEILCKPNIECFLMINIAIKRGQFFMEILKVKLVVLDINDCRPEFIDKEINISFSEGDRKGTRKSIPSAIDRDINALNSKITYHLRNATDKPFSLSMVNIQNGTDRIYITVKEKLDRETIDTYHVEVVAEDGGRPPNLSYLQVQITVTDENDNTPIFLPDAYNVSINRVVFPGELIVKLSASDADIGKNGQISYYFTSQTSTVTKYYFTLNKTTGTIYLRKKLVPNKSIDFKLFVKAVDSGQPHLSAFADVLVNVVNTENHAPKILVNLGSSSSNTAVISEAIKVGSFIGYVEVIDNDNGSNGEVICTLRDQRFYLHNLGKKKYKIKVKNPIDRESKVSHNVTIACKDKGMPPLWVKSKFYIRVIDINDVPPRFSQKSFKFWTYENQNSNFPVGFVNASDPDMGAGGELSYSLMNLNGTFSPFQITNYGYISTRVSLDREQQEIYHLRVFVKDHGVLSLNNSVSVTVEVMDENDNVPCFTFPDVNPFLVNVHYRPQNGRNITTLRAIDKDIGKNAFLTYEITEGNTRKLFILNRKTGQLSFNRVPFEKDTGIHNLQIRVRDSGIPVLHAVTNLSLILSIGNAASKTLTAVQFGTTVRIHKNLFIVIILVVMIASVCVVVLITTCLIRRNDCGRNSRVDKATATNRRREGKCFKCLPMTAVSQIDITLPEVTNKRNTWNVQLTESCVDLDTENEIDNNDCDSHPLNIQASVPTIQDVQLSSSIACTDKPKPTPRSRRVDLKFPVNNSMTQTAQQCQT